MNIETNLHHIYFDKLPIINTILLIKGDSIVKEKYNTIYKELIKAYYNGNFEETFEKLIKNNFENIDEAKEILAIMCGVEADLEADEHTYIQSIVHGITSQHVRHKIIQKVRNCSSNCEHTNGKSKCQSTCPFDAIISEKDGTKWIDENLCLNCGRCVTACDAGNYLDTPQFLPLAELLKQKQKVVAIVAPAIAGQFGKDVTLDQLREAFIKVGFTDMLEVAVAADILSILIRVVLPAPDGPKSPKISPSLIVS